jgi:hypothetical protein
MRTLALPKEVEHWSLTTLREKLVKIWANGRPCAGIPRNQVIGCLRRNFCSLN